MGMPGRSTIRSTGDATRDLAFHLWLLNPVVKFIMLAGTTGVENSLVPQYAGWLVIGTSRLVTSLMVKNLS